MCVNVFLSQSKLKCPTIFTKRFHNAHFLHTSFINAKHVHSTFSDAHKSKAHKAKDDLKGERACPKGGVC